MSLLEITAKKIIEKNKLSNECIEYLSQMKSYILIREGPTKSHKYNNTQIIGVFNNFDLAILNLLKVYEINIDIFKLNKYNEIEKKWIFSEGFGKDIDNYYYFQEKDQNKFENDQWVDSGDNIYYKFTGGIFTKYKNFMYCSCMIPFEYDYEPLNKFCEQINNEFINK